MNELSPSLYEIMTVALSRTLVDSDVGFTGLNTGGKSVLYGTAVPVVAMRMAQRSHAPNLTLLFCGWSVNPQVEALERIPDFEFGTELANLPAESHSTGYPNFVGYKRGSVSVGFCTAAQVDQFGSVNTTVIGDPLNPKVRLVGSILLPEHFTVFGREIIMMPAHDTRTFVDRVDYTSGLGHPSWREEQSDLFLGSGPQLVFSPFGIFDFSGPQKSMAARSIHPGVDKEDVRAATGFEIFGLDSAPVTPMPTDSELRLLREIDPLGRLIPLPAVIKGDQDELSGA